MLDKSDIEKYFLAEKQGGMILMCWALLMVGLSVALHVYWKSDYARGMAIPIVLLACVEFAVGYTVFKRSDRQRIDQVYAYDLEVPRMQKVVVNFRWMKWIELAVIAVGLVLFFVFRNNPAKAIWAGVGIGLGIQASFLWIFDLMASHRAEGYLNGLKSWLRV
jgi:MFS superfamily sulfate permease-like transporter